VFCQLSRCSLQGGGKNLIPENHWHRSAIRAFQAWPLLTFAARHHQLFTYQELGEHVGLPAQAVGPDSFHLVALYCEAKGLPLLNLIVVGKVSGRPEYDRVWCGFCRGLPGSAKGTAGLSLFSEPLLGLWISISGFESLGGSQHIPGGRSRSSASWHPERTRCSYAARRLLGLRFPQYQSSESKQLQSPSPASPLATRSRINGTAEARR